MVDTLTIQDRARLDFVLMARRAWTTEIYPALVSSVTDGPSPPSAETPRADWEEGVRSVAPLVHASPVYPFFAYLERAIQKQLWRAVTQAVEGKRRVEVANFDEEVGSIELDPELRLPHWYTDFDFHLQPGGVWQGEDNAFVYRLGAQVVMLGANDAAQFHRLFISTAVPQRSYHRIIDLGCGFGKSTFPLQEAFPQAEVVGVDLAQNLLSLAHTEAEQRRLPIRFRQANCTATGLEGTSADLVTATMLLHELPPTEVRSCLAEAARLLEPGGLLRVLDFQPTGEPVRDLAMVEHSDRNNEPWLKELFRSDVIGWCEELGFLDVHWVAFDERGAGRLDDARWPERHEWHFPWAVLEATRR